MKISKRQPTSLSSTSSWSNPNTLQRRPAVPGRIIIPTPVAADNTTCNNSSGLVSSTTSNNSNNSVNLQENNSLIHSDLSDGFESLHERHRLELNTVAIKEKSRWNVFGCCCWRFHLYVRRCLQRSYFPTASAGTSCKLGIKRIWFISITVIILSITISSLWYWNDSYVQEQLEAPFDHWYSIVQKHTLYRILPCPTFVNSTNSNTYNNKNNVLDDDNTPIQSSYNNNNNKTRNNNNCQHRTSTTNLNSTMIPWYMISARPWESVKPIYDQWKTEFPTLHLIPTRRMSDEISKLVLVISQQSLSSTNNSSSSSSSSLKMAQLILQQCMIMKRVNNDSISSSIRKEKVLQWKTRLFAVYAQVLEQIITNMQRTNNFKNQTWTSTRNIGDHDMVNDDNCNNVVLGDGNNNVLLDHHQHFGLIEDDVILFNPKQIQIEVDWVIKNNIMYYSLYKTQQQSLSIQSSASSSFSSSCIYEYGTQANIFSIRLAQKILNDITTSSVVVRSTTSRSKSSPLRTISSSNNNSMTDDVNKGTTSSSSTKQQTNPKFCRMPIDMYIAHLGPFYVTRHNLVTHIGKRYFPKAPRPVK